MDTKTYRKGIVIVLIAAGFFIGYSLWGEKAPLKDGLYLSYDFAGSTIRVTFHKIDSDRFRAVLDFGDADETDPDFPNPKVEKIVDRKLKTEKGTVYEAGSLGPLWIPPASVKKGGNAHGDTVQEVMQWRGWEVGVVRASFGVGAPIRGEWYYEKTTGFLVGGKRSSVMDDNDAGASFVLVDTNLEPLKA